MGTHQAGVSFEDSWTTWRNAFSTDFVALEWTMASSLDYHTYIRYCLSLLETGMIGVLPPCKPGAQSQSSGYAHDFTLAGEKVPVS